MTNASCADCGRIIAFRTYDPSETAECRGCGSWVRRSLEMPGVAVPMRAEPPQTLLPREEPHPTDQRWKRKVMLPGGEVALEGPTEKVELTAPEFKEVEEPGLVMGILEELQSAVGRLEQNQKVLLEKVQENYQEVLHQIKVLPLAKMPVSAVVKESSQEVKAPQVLPVKQPFPTTQFGSAEIALIPKSLEDLGRDDQVFVLPVTSAEAPLLRRELPRNFEEGFELDDIPRLTNESLAELAHAAGNNAAERISGFGWAGSQTQDFAEPSLDWAKKSDAPSVEEEKDPRFLETPFEGLVAPEREVEGALADSQSLELQSDAPPAFDADFAITQTEGQEIIDGPFITVPSAREDLVFENQTESGTSPWGGSGFGTQPTSPPAKDRELVTSGSVLAEEILEAKRQQKRHGGKRWLILLLLLLGLLGVAYLLNDHYRVWTPDWLYPSPQTGKQAQAPLFVRPAPGAILPTSDKHFEAAEKVAKRYLDSRDAVEAAAFVIPEHIPLLKDFFDAAGPSYTIAQDGGWLLPDQTTVRVDFLVREYNQPDRIMPVIKSGQKPWLVDFKSYMETEDVTLDGLTLGDLQLQGQSTIIEEANVRVWLRLCPEKGAALEGHTAYCLHDLAEKTLAIGAAKTGSPVDQALKSALAKSQVKHRGRTALQAIVRVKLSVPQDGKKMPGRVEIREVISTTW